MIFGLMALITAALFTRAAFYINWAEQPARLGLDDRALLAQWKPSYARGFMMQASLAVIGFGLGLAAWYSSGNWLWMAGALVLITNWPYTLLVIMPTNHELNAIALEDAGQKSRRLIESWGTLHAARTLMGTVSTLLFLAASLR